MTSDNNEINKTGRGWMAWLTCVFGWLICAGFCLALTIGLEVYPYAYDMLFPAVLLILFCNILVFLFISTKWARDAKRLFGSVLRVCVGEAIILAGLYVLGRYAIGN